MTKQVKSASERSGEPLFADDIMFRYPALKGGRIWSREHDLILLRAVLKHGYGRWQAILDDKDLQFQEVICQELNLPVINLAGIVGNHTQSGSPLANAEPTGDPPKGSNGENGPASDSASTAADAATLLYQFRETQRRQVEFIKKRVLLLEKGLNAEYQKEYFGGGKSNGVYSEEPGNPNKGTDTTTVAPDVGELVDKLPRVDVLAPAEVSSASHDTDPRRQQLAEHYNENYYVVELMTFLQNLESVLNVTSLRLFMLDAQICKVLTENERESVRAFLANEADASLGKRLHQLENICEKVNEILRRSKQPSGPSPSSKGDTPAEGQAMKKDPQKENKATPVSGQFRDVEMAESAVDAKTEAGDGKSEKAEGKSDVVVLDAYFLFHLLLKVVYRNKSIELLKPQV
ncbi:hypothetical protein Cgig2_025729 [Carnegiea gigantea]|uniref:CHD C-terminal 2 domain-containing protein n=1 Tax=Carnegiea gigantea TaxID=171969 RepID=A0A9Q1GJ93_9CARY|nr:hypothetical protein Cgig2_025729 [Carnegiea gigantea]